MPRTAGTTRKIKQTRKKMAKPLGIPVNRVPKRRARERVGLNSAMRAGNVVPGGKVKARPNESVSQMIRRLREINKNKH